MYKKLTEDDRQDEEREKNTRWGKATTWYVVLSEIVQIQEVLALECPFFQSQEMKSVLKRRDHER